MREKRVEDPEAEFEPKLIEQVQIQCERRKTIKKGLLTVWLQPKRHYKSGL
jgi:hypothetical protein